MSQTPQQLLSDALGLPSSERGRLAAILIESLDTESDPDAVELWSAEIRSRIDEIDAGRVKMIPADEARRIIRGENGAAAD